MDSVVIQLVNHWFATTNYTAVDIILHLLALQDEDCVDDNSYVILKNTQLTCPIVLMTRAVLCQHSTKQALIWQLIQCGQCHLATMYAFILAQPVTPLLKPIHKRITQQICLDNATTAALSAKRSDLQYIVLAGNRILSAVWHTPAAIELALQSALRSDQGQCWQLAQQSDFYTQLKTCLQRASIAFVCKPAQKTPTLRTIACIEGDIMLDILDKDRYLLIYLLTFATKYSQYIVTPLVPSQQQLLGIPTCLSAFWNAISQTKTFACTPIQDGQSSKFCAP